MQTQELRKQVDKENFFFLACVSAYTCFFSILACVPQMWTRLYESSCGIHRTQARPGASGIIMASITVFVRISAALELE